MPNQIQNNRQPGLLRSVDWLTILIYVVLMGLGWLSVCGASYDFGQPLVHQYGIQLALLATQ